MNIKFQKWINILKRSVLGFLFLLVMVLLVAGGYYGWRLLLRPERENRVQEIFPGVSYYRFIRESPRPIIFHTVEIDTNVNGISEVIITPPDHSKGKEHTAEVTSQFARNHDVDLATNGSFFTPFRANGPWDYYPHPGDSVDIFSVAVYDQHLYSEAEESGRRYIICWDNQRLQLARDGDLPQGVVHAIPGGIPLVLKGIHQKRPTSRKSIYAPRTAIGWNQDQSKVWLVTVDGRQPRYSDGVNIHELIDFLVQLGVYNAVNMDGGGSSTLVAKIKGKHKILNAPFHTRIPMRERPVANHFGIRLQYR